MDLAFFVVEFGFTPDEYYKLTEKEKMFIKKAHENKFIHDTTWTRNAVMNAEANANRKKSKKFIDLFPKKAHRADKQYNESAVNTILEMEKKKGKSWVDRIFKANRIKSPKKGGN
ncbi:phenylalanine racemase [Niallia sp. FSL K6-0212]|uniref:phenylalanine racemase n=1 Tax=Niallia sp. FSL K6-0212 TaxID=2921423 RepID=UPI0030FBA4E2